MYSASRVVMVMRCCFGNHHKTAALLKKKTWPCWDLWSALSCWLGIWPGSLPCVWCWRARAWGRWLTAPIGLACPHQPRLPPWASPAPMLRRRPSSGNGSWLRTRLWYSASPSMGFSLYICLVFSFSCINRQLSFFILSLLRSTGYEPGVSPLNRPLSIDQLIRPAIFPWVDLVSPPPFFRGLIWCPLPFSVGWLGVPSPFSVGWLGVPAPWVDLVSPSSVGWLGVPALGLTWCPCSLGWLDVPAPWVDLVSPLLGLTWCPRSFGRLCDDVPFLLTWWRQPHW